MYTRNSIEHINDHKMGTVKMWNAQEDAQNPLQNTVKIPDEKNLYANLTIKQI
jgi:hypothetical protein